MIRYIDRKTGKQEIEKVYGESALRFLYGGSRMGALLSDAASRSALFSHLYGWWQRQPWSKGKIAPFIENYGVDSKEFALPPDAFRSFNDFFIRALKPESRPLSSDPLILPADARYLAYATLSKDSVQVKGQKFNLEALFRDEKLAERYREGSLLIARLCPSDYHRFHFPVDCTPGEPKLINGFLYSVNPVALAKNLAIFWENKRVLTLLETEAYGTIAFFEVGATNVGTIHETFTPHQKTLKGQEKGYFSFGGSALLLFFEKGKVTFANDLLAATQAGLESRGLFGQSLLYSEI